ncbi:hypothetical protein [Thioclava sp.]|uniref:hypothetical protein n=1 Tax=Thioclava sp. TaxID=1933450 RepID=UPI003AA7B83C
MIATLPFDLRELRDRAILLLGYAGGLRCSEILGLDRHECDTPDGRGWVEITEPGVRQVLNFKTGLHEVEIGRRGSEGTCPAHMLEQWLIFSKIRFGPIFVATSRDEKTALATRLIKRTILDAEILP